MSWKKILESAKEYRVLVDIGILISILTLIATVAVPFVRDYIHAVREDAAWKTGIEKDIEYIKGKINESTKRIEELNSWKISVSAKEIQISGDEKGTSLVILGTVGLISEKLAQRGKTSYGVAYFLDYDICEANEAFDEWDKIGGLPYLGQFVEIENRYNGYKTWCMVIGSFNDRGNPNRLLVVSRKVADNLAFKQEQGVLPVEIRVINGSEWKKNKDCVRLHKDIYELKEQ